MNIVITAGGTLGHINPALSLIKEINKIHPDVKIYYVGKKNSLEEKCVSLLKEVTFVETTSLGFTKNIFKSLKAMWLFLKEVRKMKKFLRKIDCKLVLGTGGNVSAGILYAAYKLKIKTAIHEQNAVKGITNAFLSKRVDLVFTTFSNEYLKFPEKKTIHSGNPRAQESPTYQNSGLNLSKNMKIIMIAGGSLGAKNLNEVAKELILATKNKPWFFVFITGERYYKDYSDMNQNTKNVLVLAKTDKFLLYLNECDAIISRAGATTISEIIALNKKAILIPSPNVSRNHQEKNALVLKKKKACMMILEKDLNVLRLIESIEEILRVDDAMLKNLQMFKINNPAELIVKEAFKLI